MFDDIIDLEYDLPAKYAPGANFYVNRVNIRELRKLKDSDNRYLWQDPVSAGQPATFHGYPVVEDNNLTESKIFFGDLKKAYWLGDRQRMTVKISQETETAFTKDFKWSFIKGMNCWNVLKNMGIFKKISSQASPVMA